MKLLLAAVFFFICASVFGANPAYDAFRGAGGITVTSNPPNGTIIIDGSGVVASGTNSSIRASTNGTAVSAGATNINYTAGTNLVLRGTNIGSTAHINYRLADSISLGGSLNVNSNSTFSGNAQFDSPVGFSDEATFNGPIVMPAGAAAGHVITSDALGTFSWAAPTGGGSAGTNIPISQILFLDAAFGNDSTAGRTNLLRPYLTASNATAAILSGDTLVVRGGAYLVNPKNDPVNQTYAGGSFGANTSGGLAITNRSDFRITGEPGAVWQMSARNFSGSTSAAPMIVFSRCTNFVVENLTLGGIYTNGNVFQDFAIMLDRCESVTLQNLKIQNWPSMGIADDLLSGGALGVRNVRILQCQFYNVGGTNQGTGRGDGVAIGMNGTNIWIEGCYFTNCYRQIECYGGLVGNGDFREVTIKDNISHGVYGQCFVMEATRIAGVYIIGNKDYGYSTNLPSGITEAIWMTTSGMSNVVMQGNVIAGMSGFIWDFAYPLLDVKLWNNEFSDVAYRAILARKYNPVHNNIQNGLSIQNNKFRNTVNGAVQIQGNNSSIINNTFIDCNTSLQVDGVLSVGSYLDAYATNSTNVIVKDNVLLSTVVTGAVAAASGIMIYQQCYSNLVSGNIIEPRYFTTNIHNVGVGTRTRPVNLAGTNTILTTDAMGDERGVSVLTLYTTTPGQSFVLGNNNGVGGGFDYGTNFGFWNRFTESLSLYNPNPTSNHWFMSGWFNASNAVFTTMPGTGTAVVILPDGTLMRTNTLYIETANINTIYVTNFPGFSVDEFGTVTITNLVSPLIVADQIQYKMPTINVGSANSNQTVWLGETNTVNMFLTNAVTFTNFSTVNSTRSATYLAQIRVVSSTNVNVNWGLGIGYGGQVRANANNPIWTVLTNGAYYLASWTAFGTNRVLRLSLEQ